MLTRSISRIRHISCVSVTPAACAARVQHVRISNDTIARHTSLTTKTTTTMTTMAMMRQSFHSGVSRIQWDASPTQQQQEEQHSKEDVDQAELDQMVDSMEDVEQEQGETAGVSWKPWNKPLEMRPTYKVVTLVEELEYANSTTLYRTLVERYGLETFPSKRYVKRLLRFLKAQKLVDTEPDYIDRRGGYKYHCTHRYFVRK